MKRIVTRPDLFPPGPARVWCALLAAALLLGAGACQDSERRNLIGGVQAQVIAVVNNERITLEDFVDAHQLFLTRWDRFIQKDPKKKQEIKEIIIANMIDEKLLDQEARRKGIEIEENALDRKVRRLMAPFEDNQLDRAARRAGTSLDQWRRDFRRRVIHERLIKQEVVAKIRLTRRELRAYYERNREDFIRPEKVRVRHIAVSSRSQLRRVARKLRQKKKFDVLVREYSITPDRLMDGDLGFVERGVLPVEFDQAIFKLKTIGSLTSITKPVKTQMGYHIFRLEGKQDREELSFKVALPLIRKALTERKQPRAFQVWMQKLRDRATIKIDNRLLKTEMG